MLMLVLVLAIADDGAGAGVAVAAAAAGHGRPTSLRLSVGAAMSKARPVQKPSTSLAFLIYLSNIRPNLDIFDKYIKCRLS